MASGDKRRSGKTTYSLGRPCYLGEEYRRIVIAHRYYRRAHAASARPVVVANNVGELDRAYRFFPVIATELTICAWMNYLVVNSASLPFNFTTASLASPIRCWTFPTFFSAFPSAFISRSLVAFPTCSLIDPFTSWKLPLSLSFVLVFIFLLGRRAARSAVAPNRSEAVTFVIPQRCGV